MIDEHKSPHDFETTCQRLRDAVPANGFGVMHTHDIHGTLNAKGVAFAPQCRVFEVCNPGRAAEVLSVRIDLANALPCRVAVYERDGDVIVSMIRPTDMLSMLSEDADLAEIAAEVERTMHTILTEAVAG